MALTEKFGLCDAKRSLLNVKESESEFTPKDNYKRDNNKNKNYPNLEKYLCILEQRFM
jgi:hypothetical protein